jgi:hypothetical protein
MSTARVLAGLTLLIAVIGSSANGTEGREPPSDGETVVIRLVHPERQAADVLKLFDGARAPHPAAALAGWKRGTRHPNQLGKPLEAVIAMFNPEMAQEWRVMDDAELCLDLGSVDGKARWYALVPHDDGTLSAAVTAMRLTSGAAEAPAGESEGIAVERLGPAGAAVSARTGDMLILGSTREELLRGLRRIAAVSAPIVAIEVDRQSRHVSDAPSLGNRVDSGLIFDLCPGRMNAKAGTTTNRRAAALLQGLGCRRMSGNLALKEDSLALEVTTLLGHEEPSRRVPAAKAAAVDPSWLTWVPARDVMAVVSLAFEPGAAFWNSAFALADRVDRADPSRAEVTSLRTRFNLLATAAGARPEVDLWPHLRGVTASIIGDPNQPGHPAGALVILHADGDASSARIATDVLPRLSALLSGKKFEGESVRIAPPGQAAADVSQGDVRRLATVGGRTLPVPPGSQTPATSVRRLATVGGRTLPVPPGSQTPATSVRRLATVGGRTLLVFWLGHDVVIAWGDDVLSASRAAAASPDLSVAGLCTGWVRAGKTTPQRVGAFWPARCWPSVRGLDTTAPAWRALAQDPPAVWWGWSGPNEAQDSVHYSGIRNRVRQFLDELPLDPSPLR